RGGYAPHTIPCHANTMPAHSPAALLGPKNSSRAAGPKKLRPTPKITIDSALSLCYHGSDNTHKEDSPVYTLEYFLDLAGWRLIEDDGTEWRWGDKVSWWEPIGAEYVAAIGVIQGFNFDEEAAIVR